MNNYRFETLQLHVGQETPDPATDARAVPIYATASYVFQDCAHAAARFSLEEGGNIYSRLTNSTQDVLEKRIAALEGGVAALALSSGAAAIAYTIEALALNGGHIVAQKTIYGGSYNLLAHTLPNFGITASFVDIHDLDEVERAIEPNTRAIYIETLGNPNSDIPDIDALAKLAHRHGLPLVVDNTFGTPYLIRPIEHGADLVVHSATKFLGGHGTTLGGIIVDAGTFDWSASGKYPAIADPNPSYHGVSFVQAAGKAAFVTYVRAVLLRDTGACISPFAAFLLLQGVETLSLRIERHVENTKKVVEFLANHPQVERVSHPSLPEHPDHELYERYFPNGGASIFTFDIRGGEKQAHQFIDSLEIFSLLANVADVKSLVIHPATTTHSQLTQEELDDQKIKPNTIRLSIGTEHIDDILTDLQRGFDAVKEE
ncbi:O-acetylhomoserine (thiol)-lyase [Ruminococcaceae bacterium D16]|nr:O-acetylhomoserine (thiol)-lyase [Ruminococcaceae bacterium D16]